MDNINEKGNQQVVNLDSQSGKGDLNTQFLELIRLYSTGIVSALQWQKLWFILLVLALLLSMGLNCYMFFRVENYAERISKRHWELGKVIDLSQERSSKAKAK